MRGSGNGFLFAALGIFIIYMANVIVGATGTPVFLSDVVEMLTLFLACILFVIAFLMRERAARDAETPSNDTSTQGGQEA